MGGASVHAYFVNALQGAAEHGLALVIFAADAIESAHFAAHGYYSREIVLALCTFKTAAEKRFYPVSLFAA